MDKFKISGKRKNEDLFRLLSVVFGLAIIYIFIKDREISKLLLGLLLLFFSTYKKDIYISQEGLTYTYRALLFKRIEELKFKDVEDITVLSRGGNCTIFFIKGPLAKKLDINEDQLEYVLDFIEKGTDISVEFQS